MFDLHAIVKLIKKKSVIFASNCKHVALRNFQKLKFSLSKTSLSLGSRRIIAIFSYPIASAAAAYK